jgi:hypothetical protein
MRTTVDIEPALLKRLRAEAHRRGESFKDSLNRTLRRGLEDRLGPPPPPYRCPTFAMGEPSRSLEKALAVADALEADEVARELNLRK